jgi:hypothetical protein
MQPQGLHGTRGADSATATVVAACSGELKTGSWRMWLQATLGVFRAGPAVVPWQASATVSIAESFAHTFTAVYAAQHADASTCRASFREPASPLRGRSAGASAGPGRCSPPCVRSGSSRDRAADIGDGWLRAAPAACMPPSKNADGPQPHPTPRPALRFIGHRAGAVDRVLPLVTPDLPHPRRIGDERETVFPRAGLPARFRKRERRMDGTDRKMRFPAPAAPGGPGSISPDSPPARTS